MEVNVPNGVVDVEVEDEAEAVHVAQKYLSYFQGSLPGVLRAIWCSIKFIIL